MQYVTYFSLPHSMHVITHAHTSTCTTSLMHVKNSMCHFCLWDIGMKKMKEKTKTSNLVVCPLLTLS